MLSFLGLLLVFYHQFSLLLLVFISKLQVILDYYQHQITIDLVSSCYLLIISIISFRLSLISNYQATISFRVLFLTYCQHYFLTITIKLLLSDCHWAVNIKLLLSNYYYQRVSISSIYQIITMRYYYHTTTMSYSHQTISYYYQTITVTYYIITSSRHQVVIIIKLLL